MSYEILQPNDGLIHVQDFATGNNVLAAQATSKVVVREIASIARTNTSAENLFQIPAGGIPISVKLLGETESNAGTTATISIGKSGSNTYFVNAQDVKSTNGQIPCAGAANLGTALSASAATQIVGIYAESGTASSAGGPWLVMMEWYLP